MKVVAISASKKTINLYGVNVECLGKNLFNPSVFFDIMRISKKFDVAHFHLAPAHYYSLFCFCAVFITEHNEYNNRWRFKLFKLLDKFYYTKVANKTIAISNAVAKSVTKLGVPSDKIKIVYNGIDIEEIISMSNVESDEGTFGELDFDNTLHIVMVSRFSPQKDHNKLLQVAAEMPNINFVLIGDGQTRQIIAETAAKMKLSNIFFLGALANPYHIMKRCDLALQFSHWEGFGIAAIESMVLGLPTITTNTPGLNEFNVELPLIPFFSTPGETAKFIYLLLSDSKLYKLYVERSKKIANRYHIKKTVKEYIDTYEEI